MARCLITWSWRCRPRVGSAASSQVSPRRGSDVDTLEIWRCAQDLPMVRASRCLRIADAAEDGMGFGRPVPVAELRSKPAGVPASVKLPAVHFSQTTWTIATYTWPPVSGWFGGNRRDWQHGGRVRTAGEGLPIESAGFREAARCRDPQLVSSPTCVTPPGVEQQRRVWF